MMNQPESTNINRILYREWFPQIIYNHHQTGPTGTVMFSPPFRDPFNYVYDPIVVNTLDQVGAAMHTRFDAEGKPGVTTRSGSNYSTWWNGGLRTMAYFHNQVGLLTETIGNPTPETIGFVPDRVIARGDLPFPITPQVWHFRQSIDYSITANYAVLDFAQRYRETLLYNIYLAGKNSINRGNTDNWTIYPRRIAEVKDAIAKDMKVDGSADSRMVTRRPHRHRAGQVLRDRQEARVSRSARLHPFGERRRLPHRDQVRQHHDQERPDRASRDGAVHGRRQAVSGRLATCSRPRRRSARTCSTCSSRRITRTTSSIPAARRFRRTTTPAGRSRIQMGLKFDRILDAFDGPFEKIPDVIKPRARQGHRNRRRRRLRRQSQEQRRVHRRQPAAEGERRSVLRRRSQLPERRRHRRDLHHRQADDEGGARQGGAGSRPQLHRGHDAPAGAMYKLTKPRIGLWDQYGGSMPSGHVRWLLEQFEFDFERVFPPTLDAGNLKAKFDVLLFPDGGIPETDGGGGGLAVAADASRRAKRSPRSTARSSAASRSRHGAAAEGVRGSRRRDRRVRRIGGARPSPRPAGQRSPRRSRSRTAPSGRCRDEVLHPRIDPAGRRRQHQSARVRLREEGRRVLRQQPGDGAGAERDDAGRQAGGVVRFEGRRCARVGRGGSTISKAAPPPSKRSSARARCSCSDPRSPSARSRTARSSSCSTAIYYGTSVPAASGTTTTTAPHRTLTWD